MFIELLRSVASANFTAPAGHPAETSEATGRELIAAGAARELTREEAARLLAAGQQIKPQD